MRVFLLRSSLPPEGIHKVLGSLEAVAVSKDSVRSLTEIRLADHLARTSFEEGRNISRRLKYEFLLWLSGKKDIKSAMEATAPSEGSEFILIVLSGDIDIEKDLGARELGLDLPESGDPLRLERISLSRIRN
ncbi:MAG: KEOPS complex subunit Cgi121 [Candidatus Micrarchaeia archaeon]